MGLKGRCSMKLTRGTGGPVSAGAVPACWVRFWGGCSLCSLASQHLMCLNVLGGGGLSAGVAGAGWHHSGSPAGSGDAGCSMGIPSGNSSMEMSIMH